MISLSFSVSLIRFPRKESYKQFLTQGVAGGGGGASKHNEETVAEGSKCAD